MDAQHGNVPCRARVRRVKAPREVARPPQSHQLSQWNNRTFRFPEAAEDERHARRLAEAAFDRIKSDASKAVAQKEVFALPALQQSANGGRPRQVE